MLPFTGDLPNPGIEPRSPALQADSLPAESPEKPLLSRKQLVIYKYLAFLLTLLYSNSA